MGYAASLVRESQIFYPLRRPVQPNTCSTSLTKRLRPHPSNFTDGSSSPNSHLDRPI